MPNTHQHSDLERSKADFAWWYQNRFSKKPNYYLRKKMKCTCGQVFFKVEQVTLIRFSIPKRYLIRYVDFENKTADLCFSCGRNLELVANLIQEQKELRKERNKLKKRLAEIDLKLNTQK